MKIVGVINDASDCSGFSFVFEDVITKKCREIKRKAAREQFPQEVIEFYESKIVYHGFKHETMETDD